MQHQSVVAIAPPVLSQSLDEFIPWAESRFAEMMHKKQITEAKTMFILEAAYKGHSIANTCINQKVKPTSLVLRRFWIR